MIVRDLMTTRVITVQMDHSIRHVRDLFIERDFHHAIVTEAGKVVGVISDRDVLRALSPFAGKIMMERPQDQATLRRRVHQIMTRKLVSAVADMPVEEAASLMLSEHVSCLPVLDDTREPIGIITIRDLVRLAKASLEEQPEVEA